MTIWFEAPVPPDIVIERAVDEIIQAGHPLPRWGWPVPGPYNGATGLERVGAWQKVRIAERCGLLDRPRDCCLCRKEDAAHRHAEIYHRPLTSQPVCRSCHFHIHRRFARPDDWCELLQRHPDAQPWVKALRITELSRSEALRIAQRPDVFVALSGCGFNPGQ